MRIIFLLLPLFIFSQQPRSTNKGFEKIVQTPGSKTYSVKNSYGKKWKLRIDFPESTTKKKPLVIALHWAGSGNTFEVFHDCLAVPGLRQLDGIIVSPEGESQLWDTQNNINKVMQIVQFAKDHWDIDPNKIVVMGYSNGGNGSWHFAEYGSDVFSAAIPMASMYRTRKKVNIPIYGIHGAKDELFGLDRMQENINLAIEKGSDIQFVVNSGLSHFQACAYVEELKKCVAWLRQTVWKNETD